MSIHLQKAEAIGQGPKFQLLVKEKTANGLSIEAAHEVAINQIHADMTSLDNEADMAESRAMAAEAHATFAIATAQSARALANKAHAAANLSSHAKGGPLRVDDAPGLDPSVFKIVTVSEADPLLDETVVITERQPERPVAMVARAATPLPVDATVITETQPERPSEIGTGLIPETPIEVSTETIAAVETHSRVNEAKKAVVVTESQPSAPVHTKTKTSAKA